MPSLDVMISGWKAVPYVSRQSSASRWSCLASIWSYGRDIPGDGFYQVCGVDDRTTYNIGGSWMGNCKGNSPSGNDIHFIGDIPHIFDRLHGRLLSSSR